MPTQTLEGHTAIVTGSGRGIGKAIAEELAEHGANVVVTARSADEIEQVADTIRETTKGNAISVQGDISNPDHVVNLFQTTKESFENIDILVNNAAVAYPFDIMNDSWNDFKTLLDINLFGAIHCALNAAREFKNKSVSTDRTTGSTGKIINISSIHSQFSEPEMMHYDVTKGGIDAMTRSLAIELAPYDVLVNGIAPGFIETSMSIVDGENELKSNWFLDYYVEQRKIPQARAGQPEEIAKLARFLASPENTYMTGQTVFVDGGLSATF